MSQKTLKIIEKKNLWFTVSTLLILTGVVFAIFRSLNSQPMINLGIDFTGGSSFMFTSQTLNDQLENTTLSKRVVKQRFIEDLRKKLAAYNMDKAAIQITAENEIMIKTALLNNTETQNLQHFLEDQLGEIEVQEVDFIGPTIGNELRQKSLWICLITCVVLLAYISWRFEVAYGIAAIAALIHDAAITISLAIALNLEINSAFIAAILTILGYSINDTIIVFDRIRENRNTLNTNTLTEICNISIKETLKRTINTASTTLLVITALILFGGSTLKEFNTILFIGIAFGTYSSIFIASPLLVRITEGKLFKKQSAEI